MRHSLRLSLSPLSAFKPDPLSVPVPAVASVTSWPHPIHLSVFVCRCSSLDQIRGSNCRCSIPPPQDATLTRSCGWWTRSSLQQRNGYLHLLTGRYAATQFTPLITAVDSEILVHCRWEGGRVVTLYRSRYSIIFWFCPPPAWRLCNDPSQPVWRGGCRNVPYWGLHQRSALWEEVPALHTTAINTERALILNSTSTSQTRSCTWRGSYMWSAVEDEDGHQLLLEISWGILLC